MNKQTVPIITIDGPGGTGKGTLCHLLARKLHWHCLDSGAIYRVFALAAEKQHLGIDADMQKLVHLAHHLDLSFDTSIDHGHIALLDGENVSKRIRAETCGQMASQFAAIPELREALLQRQRQFAVLPGLVTDGRDMGTVVFPDAPLKIFLTASVEERAKRRYLQLQKEDNNVTLSQVVEDLTKRDQRDKNRPVAPLKAASDAVVIDTSTKTIGEVLEFVLQLAKNRNI